MQQPTVADDQASFQQQLLEINANNELVGGTPTTNIVVVRPSGVTAPEVAAGTIAALCGNRAQVLALGLVHNQSRVAQMVMSGHTRHLSALMQLVSGPGGQATLPGMLAQLSQAGAQMLHLRPINTQLTALNVAALTFPLELGVLDAFKNPYAVVLVFPDARHVEHAYGRLGRFNSISNVLFEISLPIESMCAIVGPAIAVYKVKIELYDHCRTGTQLTEVLKRHKMLVHSVFDAHTSRPRTFVYIVFFNDEHSLSIAHKLAGRDITLDTVPAKIHEWKGRDAWVEQAEQLRARAQQRQKANNDKGIINL